MARFIEDTLPIDNNPDLSRQPAAYPYERTEPYRTHTPATVNPSFRRGYYGRSNGTTTPAAPSVRVNKYAANCTACGVRVEAEQGELVKVNDKWTVRHIQPCPTVVAEPSTDQVAEAPANFNVPEGTYTVVHADETYRTMRVRRQSDDSTFMPGRFILAFLSGSNNEGDFTSFASVQDDGTVKPWARFRDNEGLREDTRTLLGDPRAAAVAYGIKSETCGLCGRKLTVPESIAAGIGPTCAGKF